VAKAGEKIVAEAIGAIVRIAAARGVEGASEETAETPVGVRAAGVPSRALPTLNSRS
jgi:hypothetical protein